ncbi:hypothetical protein KM878_15870, partial [Bacillus pumilus]|nr:hypothetical protein [Bacillus pumilus]
MPTSIPTFFSFLHSIPLFRIFSRKDANKKTLPKGKVSDRRQTPPLLQVKVGFLHFFDKNSC